VAIIAKLTKRIRTITEPEEGSESMLISEATVFKSRYSEPVSKPITFRS
jgi:hypothetical protein